MKKAVLGSMVIVSALVLSACSYVDLSNAKIVTDEYDFSQGFENIEISVSCEDVHIMLSDDDECHIVYSHPDKLRTTVEVKNDTLVVKENGHVNIPSDLNFEDATLDIYLPAGEYADIDIDTAVGDITLSNIISDSVNIDSANGNVFFEASDANDINVDIASGNVTGTLLSGKDFEIACISGDVDVPDDSEGGTFSFDTVSGDIEIEII